LLCVTVSLCVCVQVKLWDVSTQQPALIATQDLQVGAVFGAAFCPEAPWLLAAGGAMGTVAVWDITTNSAVMSKYGRKLSRAVAAVASDDSTAAEQ
jgi:periodic tryptophan protein 1